MRIEALDPTGGQSILPVAMATGKDAPWYEGEEGTEMGPTGRSFPVSRTRNTQSLQSTKGMQATRSGRSPILDLREIVKLLHIGANKLKVLKLLRRRDWLKILKLLPQKLLVNALRLFSKEKLVRMILHLPRKFALRILLSLYKIDELVKRMPTSQLMRILRSPKMDNRKLAKGIVQMEPRFLQMLMTRIFGGNRDFTKMKQPEIYKMLMQTDRALITESLKTMPFKALQPLVSFYIKQEPELLFFLSEAFVYKLLSKMPKPFLIQACDILPPDILLRMLNQLPNPMLMMAAAQIDDKSFEEYLIAEHGDLLQMLGGAA